MRGFLVACTMLAWSGTARAEEPKSLFERATEAYQRGDYAKAAAGYEEVYRLTSDPVLLFNAGQAHLLAGNLRAALAAYRSYLQNAPAAKNREMVEQRIAEVEALRKKQLSEMFEKPRPHPENEKPPVAPKPAEVPVYKRWWLWTIVGGVIVVGVGVGLAVGLTSSGSQKFATNLPDIGPAASALTVQF